MIRERTDYELEQDMIFCIIAHGQDVRYMSVVSEKFCKELISIRMDLGPLATVAHFAPDDQWVAKMLEGLGCPWPEMRGETIFELAEAIHLEERFDLRTCTEEDLRNISGIGVNIASFFLTHTR